MFGKRITIKLLTPAMFTRTFYKRNEFIEYQSYDWVPQSTLYGAISAAINRIYKKPLDILEKIHLTSATPNCPHCNIPTFFHLPESPFCTTHGIIKPKRVLLIQTIRLNPSTWQPRMYNEQGELAPNKRMSPRKFIALRPQQEFSFLVYAEDEEAKEILDKAIKAIFIRIDHQRTPGVLNLGWGKKLGWGTFEARTYRWVKAEILQKTGQKKLVIGFLQSPLTSPGGTIHMLQSIQKINAVSKTIKIRNVHHKRNFSTPLVYVEGSEVAVKVQTNYYRTDSEDWVIGFTSQYNRTIAGRSSKALEGAILVHRKAI